MNLSQMLEQAAQCTRYDTSVQSLIAKQSDEVRLAISTNDVNLLQRQMSVDECYAHETLVVQA